MKGVLFEILRKWKGAVAPAVTVAAAAAAGAGAANTPGACPAAQSSSEQPKAAPKRSRAAQSRAAQSRPRAGPEQPAGRPGHREAGRQGGAARRQALPREPRR